MVSCNLAFNPIMSGHNLLNKMIVATEEQGEWYLGQLSSNVAISVTL